MSTSVDEQIPLKSVKTSGKSIEVVYSLVNLVLSQQTSL